MSKLTPIRGFVVADNPFNMVRLTRALNSVDISVVKSAEGPNQAIRMIIEDEITPDTIDVAFIGDNLGASNIGSLAIVRNMAFGQGLAREARGESMDHDPEDLKTSPNKIVTVGSTANRDYAIELGSYSDALGKALVVDWDSAVLNLPTIASEVRRLKEII